MLGRFGTWAGQKYYLDRMGLGELVVAFFTHYSIQVYLLLATLAIGATAYLAEDPWPPLAAALAVLALYPLVEYVLHRYVLHAKFLYKSPLTAKMWKRIHYDHHQNPHDLSVLFGALYTTLPPIALITLPVGWLIGGAAGATAALAAGLLVFTGYEFCHCVQHLPFTPANSWLREVKKRHLAHHFHSEQGNYGITSGIWDRVFGTLYRSRELPRSPTVHNLGYTGHERDRYPWVGDLSASEEEYARRRTRRPA
ncbi:sterol desaturase family protein [Marinimicrococcus flavescens]|uniref:Sterol desaturase family protein n=1 Tax=Marinimicrococcus flavescens TaxID=3031815 RepID=A0AAP3V139_9PROT|nr:sterol desaturase family protein [Marinimicrococcus flavescens]